MAKIYEATPVTLADASYEVRLNGSTIVVSNVNGITAGLYAKKGSTAVTIMGQSYNLAVPSTITSIEAAAEAIKSILYVLNAPDGPSTEAIIGAQNIAGVTATDLTFGQLTPIELPAADTEN